MTDRIINHSYNLRSSKRSPPKDDCLDFTRMKKQSKTAAAAPTKVVLPVSVEEPAAEKKSSPSSSPPEPTAQPPGGLDTIFPVDRNAVTIKKLHDCIMRHHPPSFESVTTDANVPSVSRPIPIPLTDNSMQQASSICDRFYERAHIYTPGMYNDDSRACDFDTLGSSMPLTQIAPPPQIAPSFFGF